MPTGVTAMATSDTEITVSWTAPSDMGASAITGYTVQRRYTMSGGTMSAWMGVDTGCTGMDLTCMDTGLMAETMYYYRVAASNAEGMGEYTDGMATATTEMTPEELMAPMQRDRQSSGQRSRPSELESGVRRSRVHYCCD